MKEQIQKNKYYSCFQDPDGILYPEEEGIVNINYLKDLKYLNDFTHRKGLSYTTSELPSNNDHADNLFDIEISEIDGSCLLELKYYGGAYKKGSISRFKKMFMKTACLLMENIENSEMKAAEIMNAICK